MKKIILILSLLFLTNCGFESVLSIKDANFKINKIEVMINDNISSKIKKRLQIYVKKDSQPKTYNLKLNSKSDIKVSSKDTKGDPLTYEMIIQTDLEIFSKDNLIKKKVYKKSFNYNNQPNKFNLKQYEKNIEKNLIKQIAADIIINLLSI